MLDSASASNFSPYYRGKKFRNNEPAAAASPESPAPKVVDDYLERLEKEGIEPA